MRQERFDVFITGDRNLQFQQHLPAAGVVVVVLRAGSTRFGGDAPVDEASVGAFAKLEARHDNICSGVISGPLLHAERELVRELGVREWNWRSLELRYGLRQF